MHTAFKASFCPYSGRKGDEVVPGSDDGHADGSQIRGDAPTDRIPRRLGPQADERAGGIERSSS